MRHSQNVRTCQLTDGMGFMCTQLFKRYLCASEHAHCIPYLAPPLSMRPALDVANLADQMIILNKLSVPCRCEQGWALDLDCKIYCLGFHKQYLMVDLQSSSRKGLLVSDNFTA